MANFVLDKGYTATGTSAYKAGEAVVLGSDGKSVSRATTAGVRVHGIVQEDIDAGKVTTGKAIIGVRLMGIARCIAGGAVAVGDRVTNNASARVVPNAARPANFSTALPGESLGIALTPAAADGDFIDVQLTPGATW